MTTLDPRMVDLTAFDRPNDRQPRSEQSDLHLLRLVLDLQLDAMLLTLGATASAESRGELERPIPWRRWLVEDLELARALATALVDVDGGSVPGLGGGLAHGSSESSLDKLAARFENMESLLVGILERPGPGLSWRPIAAEALRRCRIRVAELYRHRRDAISAAVSLDSLSLPGEWLG